MTLSQLIIVGIKILSVRPLYLLCTVKNIKITVRVVIAHIFVLNRICDYCEADTHYFHLNSSMYVWRSNTIRDQKTFFWIEWILYFHLNSSTPVWSIKRPFFWIEWYELSFAMMLEYFDFENWQWKTKSGEHWEWKTESVRSASTNVDLLSTLFIYSTSAGGAIDNKIEQAMVSKTFIVLINCLKSLVELLKNTQNVCRDISFYEVPWNFGQNFLQVH